MYRLPVDSDNPLSWLAATKQAVSSAGYQNKALGVTQAIMLSVTRDSDALDRSNFECAVKALESELGEEEDQYYPLNRINVGYEYQSYYIDYIPSSGWHIESFSHWACGWIKYLIVDCFTEDTPDSEDQARLNRIGSPAMETQAFLTMLDIRQRLDNYPVLDEDHWSNLEWSELWDYLSSEIKYLQSSSKATTKFPKSLAYVVGKVLHSDHFAQINSCDDIRGDEIEDSLKEFGYIYKK